MGYQFGVPGSTYPPKKYPSALPGAQQTLKVRNVLSEVFVDPMPKIMLVRSLKIDIGRRRKMQATLKMITYLYKVVCFFFLQGNFHSVFGDLYFAALNKLVYLME